MARTPSTMLELGTEAPDFALPDAVSGQEIGLKDFAGRRALLVMFLCNHCPFVIHLAEALGKLAEDYRDEDIAIVGVSANDVANYPDDSPDRMTEMAQRYGWGFPYLYDETQATAKAYRAACTPDFFLFNAERELVYRGQFDGSRPGNDVPVTGEDLHAAIDRVLAGERPPEEQKPSIGCNIKWKKGNEPDYFSAS